MFKTLCVSVMALALLAGCAGKSNPIADKVVPKVAQVSGDVAKSVQQDVLAIAKTLEPDIQNALDVANTQVTHQDGSVSAVDPHGAKCLAGIQVLHKNILAILATATGQGSTGAPGLITQAEVMSIYAPESPAFQDAKTIIFDACFAKFQDAQTAMGAVANPAMLFSNLGLAATVLAPALAAGG